jgi:hypothetical protein
MTLKQVYENEGFTKGGSPNFKNKKQVNTGFGSQFGKQKSRVSISSFIQKQELMAVFEQPD